MFAKSVHDSFQNYAEAWLTFARPDFEEDVGPIRENVLRLYKIYGYQAPAVVFLRGPIQRIFFPCLIELMLSYGREESESHNFMPVREEMILRREWRLIWKEAFDSLDWNELSSIKSIGPLLNASIRTRNCELFDDAQLDIESEFGTERMLLFEEMATSVLSNPLIRVITAMVEQPGNAELYSSFLNRLPDHWARRITKIKKDGFSHFETIARDWMAADEFYWMAAYHFPHTKLKARVSDDISKPLNLWVELLLSATSFLFCQNVCFVFLKPTKCHHDEQFRFHHPTRAAVHFIDGSEYHNWHGIAIPDDIVDNPKKLKFDRIMNERNAEVRRALIDMYGFEKFIQHAFPRKLQEDEYGVLYEHRLPDDEPILVVKVTNSTPEPDGTYREYFLRVPPDTETAKEGVAWSFHLEDKDYHPKKET